MKEREQIKEQLGNFAAMYGPAAILTATVTAVNNDDDTVTVDFDNGNTMDDVRLKAVVDTGNKVLLIPKIGSVVLVGSIENSDEYVVLVVHEISEVVYLIDTTRYSVNASGFLIKKGDDTLKQILTLIVEAVQPMVVIYGNNPVYTKLAEALVKIQNLLR